MPDVKRRRDTPPDAASDRPGPVQRVRIRAVVAAFTAVYAVIGLRLFHLQFDPDLKFSEEDEIHVGTVTLERPRGNIFDREGTVLATDRIASSLFANPSAVDDPSHLVLYLSHRLHLDEDKLLRQFQERDSKGRKKKFIWIKRWLTDSERDSLSDLDGVPGFEALDFQSESLRFYPEGDLAAHVLGFANRDGAGSEGIELLFDQHLRSEDGFKKARVDSNRNMLDYLALEYEPPTGGENVYLTIDKRIQYSLERELDKVMEEKGAPRAMGMVMDPKTGAVFALATRPAFDPNSYWDFTPEQRKNRAIVDVFEPGSAFKIVTAAAGLEHGLITFDEEIDCMGGRFNPYGHTIRDTHPMGITPFWECFAQSSNIAMIKTAARLGPERIEHWIRTFGFGHRSGMELPGESPGIFRPMVQWSRLSMGSLPIGQEIAVTMAQLGAAYSVLANGGFLVRPHIVEKVVSIDGETTYTFDSTTRRRILSEDTADSMKTLCNLVVDGMGKVRGTGWRAAIPEYRAGGKTGTAQIARADGRGYETNKYTAVFAGFAPISDPRVVTVIVVQEPKMGSHHGGQASGPVFREVTREALIRLGIPKDQPLQLDGALAAQVEEKDKEPSGEDADTVVARWEAPVKDIALDSLEPIEWPADSPLDGLGLLTFRVVSGPPQAALPNFSGWTKREAKERIVELGLQWDPQGAGRVVQQDPPAGTSLGEVGICRLVFSGTPPAVEPDASK